MKRYLIGAMLIFAASNSRANLQNKQVVMDSVSGGNDTTAHYQRKITAFLPEGYVIFDQVYGDLNNDGTKDCAVIIKATEQGMIINDKYRGTLDRNRRGLLLLLDKQGQYELALRNDDCFSSENEDGGVYFAPELSVSIEKGNLYIHYGHGRYGYWSYTFRYQRGDFSLIGYDQSDNFGPVVNKETSINFFTKKKLERVNTNKDADGGDEVFEEHWGRIDIKELIKLSEIKDFDALEMVF